MSFLSVEKISAGYGGHPILADVSFQLEQGCMMGILGANGCGKTTLLNLILGLEKPDSGTVRDVPERIGYVFQEDRLCGNLSPVSNIRLTAGSHFPKQTILRALEETDLISCASQPVRELSGGQSRRVALLRALLSPYDLLLLDEPFKGLDTDTRLRIMDYTLGSVRQAAAAGNAKTVLLVTHEESEASYMADEIIRPF